VKDWKFHCSVLGVAETATLKEIRRAYRKLALERHPDRHQNNVHATEEFQQLNESYQYLVDAIEDERRPAPAIAPPWAHAPPPPATPAAPRPPARIPARLGFVGQPWFPAVVIGLLLFALSFVSELPTRKRRAREDAGREIAFRAYCKQPGPARMTFTTEEECAVRCRKNPSACEWNGVALIPTPSAKEGPNPLEEVEAKARENNRGACNIRLNLDGDREQDYSAADESRCHDLCQQFRDLHPSAGLHCQWGAEVFSHSPRRSTAAAEPAPVAEAPAAPPDDPGRTCFLTIVLPGDARTATYDNETEDGCFARCAKADGENRFAQITCSFGGKEIARKIPDAEQTYIAQNPEAVAIATGGRVVAGTCLIRGSSDGHTVPLLAAKIFPAECRARCEEQARTAPATTKITCTYGERSFLPRSGP
jgi:hypothetical protein